MRATVIDIPHSKVAAIRQLQRNTCWLGDDVLAQALLTSHPVQHGQLELIALDAAEIDRIEDFQWSPYYAGTDLYSARAADPIPPGGHCHELLARRIRQHVEPGLDVIFPYPLACHTSPWLSNIASTWHCSGECVFYICRYQSCESAWHTSFQDVRAAAGMPGGSSIAFFAQAPHSSQGEWTRSELLAMIQSTTCVIAEAMDGDGYLVWRESSWSPQA
jgi:hypothetical protein